MTDREQLLHNIGKIHTTEMGNERIRRNLKLEQDDVVKYCRDLLMDKNCRVYRQGKNWYCEVDGIKLTVNANSYTIITAHTSK
mgnify:CR=1 FL=1